MRYVHRALRVENIKIFVFHENAQKGLTIKQDELSCG